MRFPTSTAALALILMLGSDAGAAFMSGLVNVDFDNGGSAMSGPAATGSAGDFWNTFSGSSQPTPQALTLVDGATDSGATVKWSAKGTYNGGAQNPAPAGGNPLLQDYLYNNTNDPLQGVATIAGLDPTTTYQLYVYNGSNQANRITNFNVIGAATQSGSSKYQKLATYTSGSNYLMFSLTPDTNGEIAIQFYGNNGADGGGNEGNLNGFQLAAGVPEPASLGLLASAALWVLRRRR